MPLAYSVVFPSSLGNHSPTGRAASFLVPWVSAGLPADSDTPMVLVADSKNVNGIPTINEEKSCH